MRRREFIAGVGGAVAWPLAARAQQQSLPVIGYLSLGSPDVFAERLRAFRQTLKDAGFVEGRNVAIEYAGPATTSTDCPSSRTSLRTAR
jgi:putative ABC transport system substrate-binding protein